MKNLLAATIVLATAGPALASSVDFAVYGAKGVQFNGGSPDATSVYGSVGTDVDPTSGTYQVVMNNLPLHIYGGVSAEQVLDNGGANTVVDGAIVQAPAWQGLPTEQMPLFKPTIPTGNDLTLSGASATISAGNYNNLNVNSANMQIFMGAGQYNFGSFNLGNTNIQLMLDMTGGDIGIYSLNNATIGSGLDVWVNTAAAGQPASYVQITSMAWQTVLASYAGHISLESHSGFVMNGGTSNPTDFTDWLGQVRVLKDADIGSPDSVGDSSFNGKNNLYGQIVSGGKININAPANVYYTIGGTAVPEPGTLSLLGLAGLGVGVARRRRGGR